MLNVFEWAPDYSSSPTCYVRHCCFVHVPPNISGGLMSSGCLIRIIYEMLVIFHRMPERRRVIYKKKRFHVLQNLFLNLFFFNFKIYVVVFVCKATFTALFMLFFYFCYLKAKYILWCCNVFFLSVFLEGCFVVILKNNCKGS